MILQSKNMHPHHPFLFASYSCWKLFFSNILPNSFIIVLNWQNDIYFLTFQFSIYFFVPIGIKCYIWWHPKWDAPHLPCYGNLFPPCLRTEVLELFAFHKNVVKHFLNFIYWGIKVKIWMTERRTGHSFPGIVVLFKKTQLLNFFHLIKEICDSSFF